MQNAGNQNTQAILGELRAMQTQNLQDKLDAARAENTRLSGEISQQQQNNAIAGMIANAVNPLAMQLQGIRTEVDAIKRCQPATITLPNNSMTAVPTIWANGVADYVVDRIATALQPTTTTPTTPATNA
jgi:seryl-tRNA synthetase